MKKLLMIMIIGLSCISGNPLFSQIRKSLYVQTPCMLTMIKDSREDTKNPDFEIYPNPNEGNFKIRFFQKLDNSEIRVILFNQYGKIIFNEKQVVSDDQCPVYLKNPFPGLYLIRIEKGREVLNRKFIISY